MARKVRPESGSEDEENGEESGRFDEEPDFSDPEDFVDEIDDFELMPELMKSKPKESDNVDSVIVVDGVPMAGGDKLGKLKNVIKKIFSKVDSN